MENFESLSSLNKNFKERGIMAFIVNQNGVIVYGKDLGKGLKKL
jgi:hypothetical protein